jgi:hypothetical protein
MTASAPKGALPRATRVDLAMLEDTLARDPSDVRAADALAGAYLAAGRPGFAVAILRSMDDAHGKAPRLTHRLAEAYERMGRMEDARSISELAMARCEGELGGVGVLPQSPVPGAPPCTESELASYVVHREALVTMSRWGVARFDDPRRAVAHRLARRVMRVAASR